MKNQNYKILNIQNLIEGRLAMQSTQRSLLTYGVKNPTISYIFSKNFYEKYESFNELQKKHLLQVLAGPINWWKAKQAIEEYNK